MSLSIIIPLAKDDRADYLINQLQQFGYETIVVSHDTRAKSLNHGARIAKGEYLFFLHSDSSPDISGLRKLLHFLERNTDTMYYHKLKFDRKGLVFLNALAANFRSHFFSLPYGDQGFCMSKELFIRVGGFSERVPFGEDLHFVLQLKRLGKNIAELPFFMTTSARKYQTHGWLRITLMHQWRFWKILFDFKFEKCGKL